MKTITVTSAHHWSLNRKFVITIDEEITIHYYENDQRKKVKTLAEYLLVLFEMFGCIEELHIEGGNYAEVYNAIYDIKVPTHYVFINKGYKHLHEKPEFNTFNSFFDFISKFGIKPSDAEKKCYNTTRGVDYDFGSRPYYSYPDGLLCNIRDIGVFNGKHFIEVCCKR